MEFVRERAGEKRVLLRNNERRFAVQLPVAVKLNVPVHSRRASTNLPRTSSHVD